MSLFPQNIAREWKPRKKPGADEPRGWWPITDGSKLLAIDPSISATGWAILQNRRPEQDRIDSGVIRPFSTEEINRYDFLAYRIRQIIQKHAPTDAVIEVPAGGQWARSGTQMMHYARAIGVCEATCALSGVPCNRVTVTEWKGSGKKSQTAALVRHYFQHEPRDDNESDAIGIAMWLCGRRT